MSVFAKREPRSPLSPTTSPPAAAAPESAPGLRGRAAFSPGQAPYFRRPFPGGGLNLWKPYDMEVMAS